MKILLEHGEKKPEICGQCDYCRMYNMTKRGANYYCIILGSTHSESLHPNCPITEQAEQWISVNDILPKEQGHYLVHSPHDFPKNYKGRIAQFYTDNEKFYCESGEHPISGITHWMPLPQTPNTEGQ